MKAKLAPVYFQFVEDPDFQKQLSTLKTILADEAELLAPVALGEPLLMEADAVVFPQMLGDAFKRLDELKAIDRPILVVTSEFGTVSMWDWEINNYLASEGVQVIAPYSLEQTKKVCKTISLKKELPATKFLVYQDNPGEGFQADIFKRFYWWEEESIQRIKEKFGVTIEKRSYKTLGAEAKAIPDVEAERVWQAWEGRMPTTNLSRHAVLSAIKLYMAVKRDLDADPQIIAAGINCLNESHFSDTTPCLAWNMLFEEQGLVWGCEADTVSMMTKVLIHNSLGVPFMMTNLYPFLMGQAALKHEKIPNFPAVAEQPENHILAAHCGYLGVVPQSFSTDWKANEKVLAIVDENAHALDARLPQGDVTLLKLMPPYDVISVVEGELVSYAGFPGSDCRNGAVIRVPNGYKLLKELASHHYIVTVGKNLPDVETMAKVFGMEVRVIQ